MKYTYSKIYPVISNLIYFLIAFYSFMISKEIYYNKNNEIKPIFIMYSLVLFGILSFLTGVFSIYYHMNTPSWKEIPDKTDKHYFSSTALDTTFAILTLISSIVILITSVLITKKYIIYKDTNFWMMIVFAILSLICFGISTNFDDESFNCDNKTCFLESQNIYNMYHSTWHLMSGFSGIFWILVMIKFQPEYFNMVKN